MKILVIVQARMTSTRLPGKVMLPVLGKSLLYRMVERLQLVTQPIEIVIATSKLPIDDEIVNEAKKLNIPCFRGSLENLLDRHYQAALAFGADVVIKIPSDCPLIDPKIIENVIQYFKESHTAFDFVSNLHPATYPDGNDVELMTLETLQKAWFLASKSYEFEHTTPFIWENTQLFKIANIVEPSGQDYSMTHRFTIDYYEDYLFIKAVFEHFLQDLKPSFGYQDILTLLQNQPALYQINAKYIGVNWYRHHLEELKTIKSNQTKLIEHEL